MRRLYTVLIWNGMFYDDCKGEINAFPAPPIDQWKTWQTIISFPYHHHIKNALPNHILVLHTAVIFILLVGSHEMQLLHLYIISSHINTNIERNSSHRNTLLRMLYLLLYLFHNNSFDPDSPTPFLYANKKKESSQ